MSGKNRNQRDETGATRLAALGLTDCLATKQGRAFLWSLLSESNVFDLSYSPANAPHTYFREGGRNQGIALLQRIQAANAENFLTMMREANERELTNERGSEQRRSAEFGDDDAGGE